MAFFVISCTGNDDGEKMSPPVGQVEIERVKTQALIDIRTTVNIMGMPALIRMTTKPRKTETSNGGCTNSYESIDRYSTVPQNTLQGTC